MGVFEVKVYETKPGDLKKLKTEIWCYTKTIQKTMLDEIYANFALPLRTCMENEGRHLHDVIFRTMKLSE